MVHNHRKPSLPMVVLPQNRRKTIDPKGCPQPFHSMVMVTLVVNDDDDEESICCCFRRFTACPLGNAQGPGAKGTVFYIFSGHVFEIVALSQNRGHFLKILAPPTHPLPSFCPKVFYIFNRTVMKFLFWKSFRDNHFVQFPEQLYKCVSPKLSVVLSISSSKETISYKFNQ